MPRHTAILLFTILSLAAGARADQVFVEPLIVDDNLLCAGTGCANGEPDIPGRNGIKLFGGNNAILFQDSSGNDWQLTANQPTGPNTDFFFLEDVTGGTAPFVVRAGAPTNAIYIDALGRVGAGTNLPDAELHIVAPDAAATIRLEENSVTPQAHVIESNSFDGFRIQDVTASSFPFLLRPGAPVFSIVAATNGNIGLGTPAPEGKLHTKGNGVQLSYLESGDGGAVQLRFRTDSENRRFLAVNNANQVKSQIIFKDNEILFTGQTDSGANRWLTIGPSGILSQGGTCNVNPCDRTFDPSYFTVPPIAERAASMWQNQHLPAIGPTVAGEPINLTEKTTGIIHELEVAHIYIEQLHERVSAHDTEKARMQAMIDAQGARLDALERIIAAR